MRTAWLVLAIAILPATAWAQDATPAAEPGDRAPPSTTQADASDEAPPDPEAAAEPDGEAPV
nr:alpha/beta hydrolase [Myxococcota bacterium]